MLAATTPAGLIAIQLMLQFLGMSATTASWVSATMGTGFVLNALLFARMHWSGWLPLRRARILVALTSSMLPTLAVGIIASVKLRLSLLVVIAVCLVALAISLLCYLRMVNRYTPMQMRRPASVRTLGEANALVDACRLQLRDVRMPPAQRSIVEVNLAAGLAQRSALADNPEGLDEAAAILTRLIERPNVDAWVLLFAVTELVSAKDVQAARHDDISGYAAALELQRYVIRLLPQARRETATALARAHRDQAAYHMHQMTRAAQTAMDGVLEHRHKAISELRQGLAVAQPKSELSAEMQVTLGFTLAAPGVASDAEYEDGISSVREGLRRAGPSTRDFARLHLALLLIERAELEGDFDEAEALSHAVADGRSELRGQALLLLARIEARRRWVGQP